MNKKKPEHKFEVWAELRVSKNSVEAIHDFLMNEYNIHPDYLVHNMHVTVYHSRRPMFSLDEVDRKCSAFVDTYDTRLMVLAPGGENPRRDLIPGKRKVGIRIKRGCSLRNKINELREEILPHETQKVLGNRKPSSKSRNAFGARNFQPHITLLKAGSGISFDLTRVGEDFREFIPEIYFDRYVIRKRKNF